jgi:peptide/nickel transport system permease protein
VSFRDFFLVRLAWTLFGLWLAATVVFLMFFVLLPAPERNFVGGSQARPAAIKWAHKEFHFGTPVQERYAYFLWRLVAHQSPGPSADRATEEGRPIDSGYLAREALPATASLVVAALAVALVVSGVAAGALARVRWRRIFNLPIYLAFGLSPIIVGFLLSYYVGHRWRLTPVAGYCDFFNPPRDAGCGGPRDWLAHLVLPAITLSLFFAAIYTRVVLAGVLAVRAAKEPEQRKMLRRRLVLVLGRVVGRDFGFAVGLAIFVEYLFGIPGLGRGVLLSINQQVFIELQAFVLYAAFLAIAVHFVVDVIVGALDADLRAEWPVAGMPRRA